MEAIILSEEFEVIDSERKPEGCPMNALALRIG